MWGLYLRSGEGIAVRSSFKRLCDSIAIEPQDVYVGAVNYIDYDDTTWVPDELESGGRNVASEVAG